MTKPTFADLCRTAPHRAVLFVGLPLAVAGVQLLNSAVNALPLWVSVPVALVLLAASVLVTQLQLARLRRRRVAGRRVGRPAD